MRWKVATTLLTTPKYGNLIPNSSRKLSPIVGKEFCRIYTANCYDTINYTTEKSQASQTNTLANSFQYLLKE